MNSGFPRGGGVGSPGSALRPTWSGQGRSRAQTIALRLRAGQTTDSFCTEREKDCGPCVLMGQKLWGEESWWGPGKVLEPWTQPNRRGLRDGGDSWSWKPDWCMFADSCPFLLCLKSAHLIWVREIKERGFVQASVTEQPGDRIAPERITHGKKERQSTCGAGSQATSSHTGILFLEFSALTWGISSHKERKPFMFSE